MRIVSVVVGAPVTLTSSGSNYINSGAFEIPCTVVVIPGGGGGTLLVEYQVVPAGSWTNWPAGTVSDKTIYILSGPVNALRFTAAVADGVVEITQ